MSIRSGNRCTATRSWCEKPAAMQIIRGRRQSTDSATSAPSTFRTSASNSWCAESSQDR
ncbi:hypothetical protein ACWGM4_27550 [Streptomyces albidoflavus]|uniref:hypothetical protein n=1 Tax=Streptomyces sp. CAI-21 TaxID=1169743 RepID=UPI001587ABC2